MVHMVHMKNKYLAWMCCKLVHLEKKECAVCAFIQHIQLIIFV